MRLFIDILFLLLIGYYSYKFIQVLIKMRQKIISPTTKEEITAIRKYPQKIVDPPVYAKQKVGIIVYSSILLFMVVMFFVGTFTEELNWSFYLLLFLPLTYSDDLLNLFAVVDDGLLSGSRFVAWKKIKSFHFVPIDINHKYYGFSKEANEGYQLKVKAKFYSTSCVVTSAEMKEKLNNVLREHVKINEGESALKEPR